MQKQPSDEYVLSERVVVQVIRVRQVVVYAQFPFLVAGTTWALSYMTRRLNAYSSCCYAVENPIVSQSV